MQAAQKVKTDDTSSMLRYCTFRLSGRLYGVDIEDVKEINTEVNFTPIFHASREIKGYINIRGQIYLLLDLRAACVPLVSRPSFGLPVRAFPFALVCRPSLGAKDAAAGHSGHAGALGRVGLCKGPPGVFVFTMGNPGPQSAP